jgi:hypothetical protein
MDTVLTIVEPYRPYTSKCGYCGGQSEKSSLAASLNAYRMSCSVWVIPRRRGDVLLTRQVRDAVQSNTRLLLATARRNKRCIRE